MEHLNLVRLYGDSIPCDKSTPSLSALAPEMLTIGQILISWSVSMRAHIGTSPPPLRLKANHT